jgi:VWFA-related protein
MRLVTRWQTPSVGALMMVITTVVLGAQGTRSTAPPSPDPASQTPTFRVGTDLLTVDVSVVDSSGKPVEGLTPADFTIKIDGKVRKVMAAEVSKPDTESVGSLGHGQPGVTITQTEAARPRHVLFVVDQMYIPPGSIKPLLISASKFLDQLAPRDQVGFIAFPVGPHVDFTTDKAKVRDAMSGMVGSPSLDRIGQLAINIGEARTVTDRERYQLSTAYPPQPWDETTPILLTLFQRNCPLGSDGTDNEREVCKQQILSQSSEIAQRSRSDAKASVATLESIVKQMAPIEGSKSMILVSAAMAINETRDVDELIRQAALSRTSFNVLVVDPPEENKNIGRNPYERTRPQPNTELDDRRIRLEGLEEIAADGRGAVYRIAGTGEGVFTRLATELSASYVLGLESLPDDLGKGQRKVEVTVKKPGARVRTAQAYINTTAAVATTAADRRVDPVLREALSASSERTEVPLRVAAFKRWDTASNKIRVNLTASIGQPGARADDFTVGYAILDKQNKTVVSATQKPSSADAGRPAPFGTSLLLDPGVYSLRLSVVNGEGRRSTVIRELDASRATVDDLATSDLVVGEAQGQALTPSAEPHITSGKLAAYLELYSEKAEDLDWTFVHVDVARDEKGEALATEEADVANGPRPSWRVASGVVPLNGLAPGSYVARARIVRDDKVIRTLTSPFVIDAPSGAAR